MSVNYGNVVRQLRIGKNKSLSDIANDVVSKSFISKFERGESDITFTRLLNILHSLNVSLSEVSSLIEEAEKIDSIDQFMINVSSMYYRKDINALNETVFDCLNQYNYSGNSDYLYESLLAKSMLMGVEGKILSQEDNLVISDYLLGVEYWSKYELIILTNCIPVMNLKIVVLLADELIRKKRIFGDYKDDLEVRTALLFNTISCCFTNNDYKQSKKYIHQIEQMKLNDTFLYEKILLKLFKVLYEVNDNSIESFDAMKIIAEIMSLLESVDASQLAAMVKALVDLHFRTL